MKPGRYLGLRSELTFERFQGAALIGKKFNLRWGPPLRDQSGDIREISKKQPALGLRRPLPFSIVPGGTRPQPFLSERRLMRLLALDTVGVCVPFGSRGVTRRTGDWQ